MNKILKIRNKLNGPIFSVITPFTKKGEIDYSSLKKYLEYLYLKGARNFYVMAYNSRLTLYKANQKIK
jgi:dihydrodipicolinate synthase/N-acetylneuraminate lyase